MIGANLNNIACNPERDGRRYSAGGLHLRRKFRNVAVVFREYLDVALPITLNNLRSRSATAENYRRTLLHMFPST